MENGTYWVEKLYLIDGALNMETFTADASNPPTSFVEAAGIVPPLFTFQGGSDYTPPVVTSITMDSGLYDMVGGPTNAVLTVTGSDSSGISSACISIDEATWFREVSLGCPNAIDNGDGTFDFVIQLPDYLKNSLAYQPVNIQVFDSFGNWERFYKLSGVIPILSRTDQRL